MLGDEFLDKPVYSRRIYRTQDTSIAGRYDASTVQDREAITKKPLQISHVQPIQRYFAVRSPNEIRTVPNELMGTR
jgi:hypothetical protein